MSVEAQIRDYVHDLTHHTDPIPIAQCQQSSTPGRALVRNLAVAAAIVLITIPAVWLLVARTGDPAHSNEAGISTPVLTTAPIDNVPATTNPVTATAATTTGPAATDPTTTTQTTLLVDPTTSEIGIVPDVRIGLTHADFALYVAQARRVLGPVEIGDSCEGWPPRMIDELDELIVVPATPGDVECVVAGWTYTALMPDDMPDGSVRWEGTTALGPIFDASGALIGHFPPSTGCRHTVVVGDNPSRVAEEYGITVDELSAANIGNPVYQNFLIGWQLNIPIDGAC